MRAAVPRSPPRRDGAARPRRCGPPPGAAPRPPPRRRGRRPPAVPRDRRRAPVRPAPSAGGSRRPSAGARPARRRPPRRSSGPEGYSAARAAWAWVSEVPVISRGCFRPISSSRVGATSASRPSRSDGRAAAHQQHRDRVGGVRGVRAAGRGVAHLLAVAVIGGDQQRAALLFHRGGDAAEAGIHRLHGLDRGGRLPVWPTMSGLAKFSTIRSYLPSRSPPPPCR